MNKFKEIFCIILISLLTSCATMPTKIYPFTHSRTEQIQQFKAITQWNLSGILSIRTNNSGGSAHWSWQQMGENYTILLSGPLGAGSVRITGKPNLILLQTANGKKISATTADQLLAEQTGWPLPIANLYYWIRTLPAPKSAYQQQLNSNNQIIFLKQKNWEINYQYANNKIFPTQITVKNPDILIKIIVKTED